MIPSQLHPIPLIWQVFKTNCSVRILKEQTASKAAEKARQNSHKRRLKCARMVGGRIAAEREELRQKPRCNDSVHSSPPGCIYTHFSVALHLQDCTSRAVKGAPASPSETVYNGNLINSFLTRSRQSKPRTFRIVRSETEIRGEGEVERIAGDEKQ